MSKERWGSFFRFFGFIGLNRRWYSKNCIISNQTFHIAFLSWETSLSRGMKIGKFLIYFFIFHVILYKKLLDPKFHKLFNCISNKCLPFYLTKLSCFKVGQQWFSVALALLVFITIDSKVSFFRQLQNSFIDYDYNR